MNLYSSLCKLYCLLMLFFYQVQANHLLYSKIHSTITVFGQDQTQIILEVDFSSNQIHLPQSMKNSLEFFYLTKHKKNKVLLRKHYDTQTNQFIKEHLFYDFNIYEKQFNDGKKIQISGKIGLKPHDNLFLKLIKLSNHQDSIRLDFGAENHDLQFIFQSCSSPTKFPLILRIEGQKQKDVTLHQISNNFIPDQQFISRVIGGKNDKFTLSSQEMQQNQIKLTANGKVQKVLIKKLIHKYCNKVSESNSYECSLIHFKQSNGDKTCFQGLLMYFDFSICENEIQIYSNNIQSQETYFILHYILLFFVFAAGVVYKNDNFFVKIIKRVLKKRKGI